MSKEILASEKIAKQLKVADELLAGYNDPKRPPVPFERTMSVMQLIATLEVALQTARLTEMLMSKRAAKSTAGRMFREEL